MGKSKLLDTKELTSDKNMKAALSVIGTLAVVDILGAKLPGGNIGKMAAKVVLPGLIAGKIGGAKLATAGMTAGVALVAAEMYIKYVQSAVMKTADKNKTKGYVNQHIELPAPENKTIPSTNAALYHQRVAEQNGRQ
ncbi:MAG: hypothetical protein JW917_00870 [Ignavibacteria bacterium]|nr:hypothetical protein [Ignavibacteria bacterium]